MWPSFFYPYLNFGTLVLEAEKADPTNIYLHWKENHQRKVHATQKTPPLMFTHELGWLFHKRHKNNRESIQTFQIFHIQRSLNLQT